ncbi:hypothetical protein NDU88_002033 [Pleurodeles waltl]|uniref:Uncharacterized protein n=1 Tax=Pleurodeles waltl TaxID=8319 RepID=A0AAV7VDL9_PLEWA|nr:hypothetical protein NDU88_002033 [Pleurodeles waltl]
MWKRLAVGFLRGGDSLSGEPVVDPGSSSCDHSIRCPAGRGVPATRVVPRPVSSGGPNPRSPWRGRALGPHRVPHGVAVQLGVVPRWAHFPLQARSQGHRSLRLLRCTGIQAPGVRSTDLRAPIGPRARRVRIRSLPALPTLRTAAHRASFRPRRTVRRPPALPQRPRSAPAGRDWCGGRLMALAAGRSPPRARPGSRVGAALQRLQALPSSGFQAPRVRGRRGTPRVPVVTEAGSDVAVDLGG